MRFSNGPKASVLGLVVGLAALALVPHSARGETSVGVRVGTSGFEFGFLYNDYYHADDHVVVGCSEWMSEPDMVVALHLARVADMDLEIILDWRRGGLTWYDITHRCHRDTNIYYVDLPSDPGPPYGRAWGHWRKHPRQDMRMSDDEIRSFTTLRALSEYSRQRPSEVLQMRRQGKSPSQIAGKHRSKSEDAAPRGSESSSDKGKSNGKSNGKSKGKGH